MDSATGGGVKVDEGGEEMKQGRGRHWEGPSNSCYVDKESQKCSCMDELWANATLTSRYT